MTLIAPHLEDSSFYESLSVILIRPEAPIPTMMIGT